MQQNTTINEIIKTLDVISENKDNKLLYILGGFIVGATIVRDDIDDLYIQYPGLESIAELGAELETLEDNALAIPVFKQFQDSLAYFKKHIEV